MTPPPRDHENARSPCGEKRATVREEREPNLPRAAGWGNANAFAGQQRDLTRLPLHLRKTNLEQLLRGRPDSIFVAPFEQGKIGPDLFDTACRMALRVWSPSTASAPTAPAGAITG